MDVPVTPIPVVNGVQLSVDLWGPADESTLMDEPLQWQGSLTAFWKRTQLSLLWGVGLAATSSERVDP